MNRQARGIDIAARAGTARPAGDAAFTLVEMLVAVGALALISIGLARVFSAASQTVKVGREVSRLNESAALIQRQIRDDIAHMSRGGFMVIVNQRANEYGNNAGDPGSGPDGLPIKLSTDDTTDGRPRRVDELMFFADGSFVTSRPSIAPSLTAASTQARIYYGHGLRWETTKTSYTDPIDIEDQLSRGDPQVETPGFGSVGPNQYASDWILLRHRTLLAQPSNEERSRDGIPAAAILDNDYQIAGQPASPSIFRILQSPNPPSASDLVRGSDVRPGFACGCIDIATTSLAEIRSIVLDATPASDVQSNGWVWEPDLDDSSIFFPPTNLSSPSTPTSLDSMKYWMQQALPTNSNAPYTNNNDGGRMHCELSPPNVQGTLSSSFRGVQPEYARADQMALTASNFVPSCTEFIVEWSFGLRHPLRGSGNTAGAPGEIIWHGLERWVDFDGDGVIDRTKNDKLVAKPYLENLTVSDPAPTVGSFAYDSAYPSVSGYFPAELIHDTPNPEMLYSYFGYIDPITQADWPWPTMLRITMSLADPSDPTTERTFQFIVELPKATDANQY